MRYEAKHSYFKQISQTVRNYNNPAWTYAFRHQQVQCKHFLEGSEKCLKIFASTVTKKILVLLSTHFDVSSHVSDVRSQIAEKFSLRDFDCIVTILSWIMYSSTLFKNLPFGVELVALLVKIRLAIGEGKMPRKILSFYVPCKVKLRLGLVTLLRYLNVIGNIFSNTKCFK